MPLIVTYYLVQKLEADHQNNIVKPDWLCLDYAEYTRLNDIPYKHESYLLCQGGITC